MEADGAAVAALVLSRFPQEHTAVLSELRASPQLQFRYLTQAPSYIATSAAMGLSLDLCLGDRLTC